MKKLKWLLPSFITLIVLLIIFACNGLFPFGKNALIQIDADFQFIPSLYKMYDLLHFKGSIFFSDMGLGNSLFAPLIAQRTLFSPLNLMLLLIKRNDIVYFNGLFIAFKLCLLSLTSYFYISKKYSKVSYFYQVLFALINTINGYMVFNFLNEMWLDILILFPLLIYYLDEILKGNNNLKYPILLSICFILNLYVGYFILLFVLLYSATYLYLIKKKDYKKIIFNLGKYTLIALLISSFSTIPYLYQIMTSSRFRDKFTTEMFTYFTLKTLYLLFSPILLILITKLFTKFKEDKYHIFRYFILFILYIIPIFIDPINAPLNGGSYWSFPYRYGFITIFILIDGSLYYIANHMKEKTNKIDIMAVLSSIIIIWFGYLAFYITKMYCDTIRTDGIILEISNTNYIHILYIILLFFGMYLFLYFINNKYLKRTLLFVITIYSFFIFTSFTIFSNDYENTINANNINNKLENKPSGRYKVDGPFSDDYGYILNVDAMDNWLHLVPHSELDVYNKLGYLVEGSSVSSVGGTIFTDYLLNLRNFFTYDAYEDDMYTFIEKIDDTNFYKFNYNENYGIVVKDPKTLDSDNRFYYQNFIYHNLYNTDKDIVTFDNYSYKNKSIIELDYHLDKTAFVYFNTYDFDAVDYITINDNTVYNYNNYIKDLGIYEGDVHIEINLNSGHDINFDIGYIYEEDVLSLESPVKYENGIYKVSSNEEDNYLILPINNINGISVYDNDKKVNTSKYMDNFIMIKLLKGDNNIKVKYELPYFKISIIISIIGIILLLISKKILPNKIILNIGFYLFHIIVILSIGYLYFYSIFQFLER